MSSVIGWYLVEVTGTLALQELLVAPHGDAQGVDGFVPMMLCGVNDVTVRSMELLDLPLQVTGDNGKQVRTDRKWVCLLPPPRRWQPTRLSERIPSTGRWKPIPRDLTTTRTSCRDSLNHRRRRGKEVVTF